MQERKRVTMQEVQGVREHLRKRSQNTLSAAQLEILYAMHQAMFGLPAYKDAQADGVK